MAWGRQQAVLPNPLLAQSGGSDLTGLAGWVADVVAATGSVGIGLLVLIETVFPPIPSEVVLPLGGYLGSQGNLSIVGAVVASTAGALAGALVLYGAGARLGHRRVDAVLGRLPLVELDDLDRAHSWFQRYGGPAVFFGRMIPGVRSFISIPAGVERMSMWRFVVYTTVGSLVWNVGLIGLGWLLGSQWQNIGEYSDYLNYALIGAILVVVGRFVWRRRGRLRSRSTAS